ncbi:MAG: DnaJ domain-containing protein [Chloroflexota bacterium]
MQQRLLPYSPDRDIYRLLQVDPRAGTDEVTAACRRLARAFHPDRNDSGRAHEEMQVVNAIRGLVADPAARAEYDIARWRFWASRDASLQVRTADTTTHPVRRSRIGIRLRAAVVGVRAAVTALAPPRCATCRSVIGSDDRYCVACGRLLLTGG